MKAWKLIVALTGALFAHTALGNIYKDKRLNMDHAFNYKQLHNVQTDVETLTTDVFGDRIDPGTGSLQFTQTDVSIPGNFALPVAVSRTLSGPDSWFQEARQLGNWSLDLPHARSTYVTYGNDYKTAYWPSGKACTKPLNANPSFQRSFEMGPLIMLYALFPSQYWNGDSIYIPGQGSTKLLTREGDTTYKRYNNKQWDVACGTAPGGHDSFIVTTDDGTKYYLTEQRIVTEDEPMTLSPSDITFPCVLINDQKCEPDSITPDEPNPSMELHKHHIFLLASKVEDKFGNTVEYSYTNGNLTKIEASDGRVITLAYNSANHLSKVTANERDWLYSYDTKDFGRKVLSTVTLPDLRTWTYDNNNKFYKTHYWSQLYPPQKRYDDTCLAGIGETAYVKMTHPYGLKGTFYVNGHCQGQSDVPKIRRREFDGVPTAHWIKTENRMVVLSRKTLELSDNQSYDWTYQYSSKPGQFAGLPFTDDHRIPFGIDTVESGHLNSTKIIQPDGHYQIHYFDRRYGKQQGNALYVESYDKNHVLLQRVSSSYDYSANYGKNRAEMYIEFSPDNHVPPLKTYSDTQLTRLKSHTLTQFAVDENTTSSTKTASNDYIQTTLDFNDRNQPITVRGAFNNQAGELSREHYFRYGYVNDTANGVYGLPTTLQMSATPFAANDYSSGLLLETTYKALNDTKTVLVTNEQKRFGTWQTRVADYTPEGNPKKVEYNRNLSFSETSKVGDHRYIEYGAYYRGQPQTITVPGRYGGNPQTAHQKIDANGWVEHFIDFADHKTLYHYDKMGRIVSVKSSEAQWLDTLFSWSYPDAGPIRTVTRCELATSKTECLENTTTLKTTTQYDTMLRAIQVASTDVKNNITHYQINAFNSSNQPTKQSFPTASLSVTDGISFEYDGMGRQIKQSVDHGGTTKTTYLADNRIKVVSDQNATDSSETITTYLAYGAPTYDQALNIQSPEGVTTELAVNLWGNITAITQKDRNDASNAISHTETRTYDPVTQRLTKTSRGDVGDTHFGYNAAGEIIWQAYGTLTSPENHCTNSNTATNVICFQYDNLGDKHKAIFTDGTPEHTHTYDKLGNLTQLTTGQVTQSYQYNSQNLLELETMMVDGKAHTFDYEYDAMGHLKALTYPDPEVGKVSYTTNAFGQSTSATRASDGFIYAQGATYYPTGTLNTLTFGNGIQHKTEVDKRGMPKQLKATNGEKSILDLSYTYDYQNNVTSLIDSVDNKFSLTKLQYDGLDRLTSVTGGESIGNSTIKYDALGNITEYNTKDSKLAYSYDRTLNRLTGITKNGDQSKLFYDFAGGYDTRGNVIKRDKAGKVDTFTYNLANQMTSANGNTTYVYDGHNRRVKATRPGKGDAYSAYNLHGKLLYRQNQKGATSYIFLGDKLIAKDSSEYQGPGSRMHYRPFGDTVEAPKDDVGYTGHKFDTDLHLSYMQARYYDPVIGRFLSNDPVGWVPKSPVNSFGRYTYTNNNPYKYTDPDGRFAFLVPVAVFLMKEIAAEGLSQATGGLTDVLSTRRMGKMALNKVADAVQTGIKEQAKKASKAHGNSKSSTKDQHLYMIEDADGNIKKIGVSSQKLNSNGSSPRANAQLKDGDTATVLETEIKGRKSVLQKEAQLVEGLKKAGHELPDNKRPKV